MEGRIADVHRVGMRVEDHHGLAAADPGDQVALAQELALVAGKKVAASLRNARGVAGRIGRWNRNQVREEREQLLAQPAPVHQPTFRIVSRAAVTAAVVFSRLRGAGGGIF